MIIRKAIVSVGKCFVLKLLVRVSAVCIRTRTTLRATTVGREKVVARPVANMSASMASELTLWSSVSPHLCR